MCKYEFLVFVQTFEKSSSRATFNSFVAEGEVDGRSRQPIKPVLGRRIRPWQRASAIRRVHSEVFNIPITGHAHDSP